MNTREKLIGAALALFVLWVLAPRGAVVYDREPHPLPLNAGMIGTNTIPVRLSGDVWLNPWPKSLLVMGANKVTNGYLQRPSEEHRRFAIEHPEQVNPYNTTENDWNHPLVYTDYIIGFLDGTNRVELGSFLKLNDSRR